MSHAFGYRMFHIVVNAPKPLLYLALSTIYEHLFFRQIALNLELSLSMKHSKIAEILSRQSDDILERWVSEQLSTIPNGDKRIKEKDLREESFRFLKLLGEAVQSGNFTSIDAPDWKSTRDFLQQISRSRAVQRFSPSETAGFILSLKSPLFERIGKDIKEPTELQRELWLITTILDRLGLYTTEAYTETREALIRNQQQDLLELSTPVVKLWDGIVALPLIGTLDSSRTQVVMENLLRTITETGASVAILDITGVPTVDTLVAQHLLKTITAARLMGAKCIISGIRPQTAQTIVHLGVDLSNVITKASLADAFAVALKFIGATIVKQTRTHDERSKHGSDSHFANG